MVGQLLSSLFIFWLQTFPRRKWEWPTPSASSFTQEKYLTKYFLTSEKLCPGKKSSSATSQDFSSPKLQSDELSQNKRRENRALVLGALSRNAKVDCETFKDGWRCIQSITEIGCGRDRDRSGPICLAEKICITPHKNRLKGHVDFLEDVGCHLLKAKKLGMNAFSFSESARLFERWCRRKIS